MCCFPLVAASQNYQCKTMLALDTIRLDTLPVEAGSITISPSVSFRLMDNDRYLVLEGEALPDSIEVCYRTIAPRLYQPFFRRSVRTYAGEGGSYSPQSQLGQRIEEEEIFDFGSVESYGAITRGVTFGNRQNLFVNSSLNLQMTGDLSEDLKVSAVITDQNIPYQPEGNTQQIRDFDNVFIKLYNDDFEAVAGDIVLENPVVGSYFLKYYKNVQGLSLGYNYKFGTNWRARSFVSGSLAKGQFTSAVIEPIEGVQGPYKLRGPNGERFIIVLANSERVYLDGQLLERGFDQDYIIDYNLGEVTFSSDVVITRFSRIRIDYEYADQYYSRSNISAVQELSGDRTRLYFNYYREKDSPTATLGFDLTDEDLVSLRAAGDDQRLAVVSGIDSVQFSTNGIFYQKKDTTDLSGIPQVIYQYSTDPQVASYRVSFSEVGHGNGHYVITTTTSNGKVYEWVSPLGGEPQGNYAPVRAIPTPNQKQVFVIGARHKLSEHEEVFQETAISGFDHNLYSAIDDEDNEGVAWKGGVQSMGREMDFLYGYKINSTLSFEYNHRDFIAIDRFRSVDFDRDWSYNVFADSINRQDQILNASLDVVKDAKNAIGYEFSMRNRSEVIDGAQHELNVAKEVGPFFLSSRNFYLKNQSGEIRSEWLRSNQLIRFNRWLVQPGYQFTADRHRASNSSTDSLLSTLMHYVAHDFFVTTADSSRSHVRLDFIKRKDQLPISGEMLPYTEADEVRLGSSLSIFSTHKIGAQINYRKVKEQTGERNSEKNLMGRINWSGGFLGNLIRNNLVYTTANSRELKREFIFINVPTGEGTHTWRDENNDGLQDVNEFYEALNPDEKNYIKLFTPTDEYINAYQTTFVETLDAQFPLKWKQRGGVLAGLSKVSFNTSLKYNFKTADDAFRSRLDPFSLDLEDENILAAHNLIRSTFFYNRNAPGFGFDLSRSIQQRKTLLSNGFELNKKDDWISTAKMGFGTVFTVRAKGGIGITSNSSDFLLSRNFNLRRNTIATDFVWQPLTTFRLITGYERRGKNTFRSEVTGSSGINEFHVETTWIRSGKGNLNAGFNWIDIDFSGQQNTYLAYELLEALQPGSNQRWRVNWQQTIGKGLQLSVQYNGRKSAQSDMIHTGTMQVTAFF